MNGEEDVTDARLAALARLVGIVDRLRAPGGCPWDRDQSLANMAPHLLEEAYEAADALLGGAAAAAREELGDLLMNVLLAARIAEDGGQFSLGEVAEGIAEKLVRRHPHVFGPGGAGAASGVGQVLANWERIKAEERQGDADASVLKGVPKALPALLRAYRLGEKAARVGFRWPDLAGALAKFEEERRELLAALESGDARAVEEELGDLLFAVVNVARQQGVEPESALRRAAVRFERRFRALERRLPSGMHEVGAERLAEFWREAKLDLLDLPPEAPDLWRRTLADLVERREALLQGVAGLPPDLLARRPDEAVSRWSAAGVLEHVLRVEQAVVQGLARSRTAAAAQGALVPFPGDAAALHEWNGTTTERAAPPFALPAGRFAAAELVPRLAALREETLALAVELLPFDPRAVRLEAPGGEQRHALDWYRFLAEHDRVHARQLLRIRARLAAR